MIDLFTRSSALGASLLVESSLIEQLSFCGFQNIGIMKLNKDRSYIGVIAKMSRY